MAAHGKLSIWKLPALVLLSGLVLSAWAGFWLHRELKLENTAEFTRLTQQISSEIEQRFRLPVYGLNGARGVFAAKDRVTRQDFSDYVASRNMKVEFPGVRGFGFIERVQPAQLQQFLQETRADNAPDFHLKQLTPRLDADLLVIKFIEPLLRNLQAVGLDVASEQMRRQAAELAIETGKPTITGPVVLLQDNENSAGVLLYVPLYQKPDITGQHTRSHATFRGLLYAPLVVRELLDNLHPGIEQYVHFELFDNPEQGGVEFYDNLDLLAYQTPEKSAFVREQSLQLPGRLVRIKFSSMAAFEKSLDTSTPWALSIIGGLLSIALSGLLWLQIERRAKAETLAAQMSSEVERLAMVVKRTANSVMITDVNRYITWVNPAFERLTGYTEQEVLGRKPTFLQTPSSDPAELARLSAALANHAPYRGELLNQAKNGQLYWIDLEIQPIAADTATPAGFMAISTDITARKFAQQRLEAAIRDNQALLTTLHLHSIVSVADQQAVMLDVNDALCLLSGYRREELIGRNHAIFHSGQHQAEFWREMWMQISAGRPWHGEICNRAKQGELFWLDTTIAPFTDDSGQIVRYIAISRDITQSKRLQYGLQSARDQLKKAIEIADLATWRWELSDDSLHWDDRMYQLYDVTDEERQKQLLYRTWRSRVHPDDIPEVERQLHQSLQGHCTFHPAFRIFDRHGAIRYIQAVGQVETDLSGKVVRMLGVNRDVTVDKQTEELLKVAKSTADEANKAKSEFLVKMSDDLRSPLNNLLGRMAQLRQTPLVGEQQHYVQESELATRELLGMLDDILDAAKIEAGTMELAQLPFALDPLVQDVCQLMARHVGQKSVSLWCDMDAQLPQKLIGDALRLRQVLVNLTANVVKTVTQGDVVLQIRRLKAPWPQVGVAIAVKASGSIIDAKRRAELFRSMQQQEPTLGQDLATAGLGLVLCQRFIRMMQGSLELQCTQDKGFVFSFQCHFNAAGSESATLLAATSWPQLILLCPHDAHREHLQKSLAALVPKLHSCLHLPALKQLLMASPNAVVLFDAEDPQQQSLLPLQHQFPDVRWLRLMPVGALQSAVLPKIVATDLKQPFTLGMLADALSHSVIWSPEPSSTSLLGSKALVPDVDVDTAEQCSLPTFEQIRKLAELAGIDWDLTQQRLDGQIIFYLKMLPVLIRSLEQISRELGQMREDNREGLQLVCHKLKGNAAQMGMLQLAERANSIEQQLKQGNSVSEEQLLALSRYVQESVDALHNFNLALPAELQV